MADKAAAMEFLRRHLSPLFSYQLMWDAFLHLACAWEMRDTLPPQSHLRRLLRQLVDNQIETITDERERTAVKTKALFAFVLGRLVDYVGSEQLDTASPLALPAKIASINPTRFREFSLGATGAAIITAVLSRLDPMSGRILVTVDGFDTIAGYFTTHGENATKQSDFELEILLSLLQTILNKGPARISGGKIYEVTDFCVAIPYDRFIALRSVDRDRYQYRDRFASVQWSGMELSALVRKRLVLLSGLKDRKGPPIEDRLNEIVENGFPQLPERLEFQFGPKRYKLPLFTYVLRHTFWRPRDVLFYYAALLAASRPYKADKKVMPTGFVRQIIAGATRFIVEDEFLKEFEESFCNLRQVISLFMHSPQVLDWKSLEERIEATRFEIPLSIEEVPNMQWKVEQLYDVGVLGVILQGAQAEKLSSFRHAFSFSEGNVLSEKIGRDMYARLHYALHPVFVEYLLLDTSQNLELILPLDWSDLRANEKLRRYVPPE